MTQLTSDVTSKFAAQCKWSELFMFSRRSADRAGEQRDEGQHLGVRAGG